MREIKFRAWNYTRNEMSYDIESIDFDKGRVEQINTLQDRILFPTKEAVLMQYTGLKDKNGVEIYEGDIVEHPDYYRAGPVIFDEWYARFAVEADEDDESLALNKHTFGQEVEVIGNIYKNPELLENTND